MAMNFRRGSRDEPEINLIPFIDVLLVILIFLMLTTTYSRYTQMQVRLPTADAERAQEKPRQLIVTVSADGRYMVDKVTLPARTVDAVQLALVEAAKGGPETMVVISADALAPHQSVITVMEAARRAGLPQITFATQSAATAGARP
jgi:biopolymer transport protein ExbD